MKNLVFLILPFLCLAYLTDKVMGQEANDTITKWRIETQDGNEFIGTIILETDNTFQLSSENYGVLTINKNNIRLKVKIQAEKTVSGQLWVENSQSTRYFWAPNGYGLKQGEGYYQNVWVLFSQASYGFSDYFSVGVGMVPMFLFAGTSTPAWITPKFSIPVVKDKINVGSGILAGTIIGESSSNFGIAYGVFTLGDKNNNLNLGVGYGFAGGDWAKKPTITLSSMLRINRRGYFITENYYINAGSESLTLISFGGRTVWSNVSLDYGLVIPLITDLDNFIAIPWLGFLVPFGNREIQNN
ncbi:MAG: hypothetical protein JXJ22_06845 [Bacteroidales bacterium]|nr:hypothetical protein [Bacteroidales bacterium]